MKGRERKISEAKLQIKLCSSFNTDIETEITEGGSFDTNIF